MKKLLALVLVLAISASANAGIVDLQISGFGAAGAMTPINPVSQYTIAPSQYVWIDIIYSDQGGSDLFSLDSYLQVSGPGTISFTENTYPAGAWDMTWPGSGAFTDAGGPYVTVTAGLTAAGVANGIAVDHILLHCEGPGDVTVVPVLSDAHGGSYDFEFSTPSVGAGVTIHQIPEPFTMALMGLGGLVALRRRR
jgi:hypothetical protein